MAVVPDIKVRIIVDTAPAEAAINAARVRIAYLTVAMACLGNCLPQLTRGS